MRRLAGVKEWEYVHTYSDKELSGALPIMERPGLCELVDDANAHQFEAVICLDASRLARDQRIFWDLIGRFRDLKIVFITCVLPQIDSNSPEFEIVAGTLQGMASYDRKLTGIKTKLAHKILEKQHKAHGRPMYGFIIGKDGRYAPGEEGKVAIEKLELNPDVSPLVLMEALGIEYKKAWALLKNAKSYLETREQIEAISRASSSG